MKKYVKVFVIVNALITVMAFAVYANDMFAMFATRYDSAWTLYYMRVAVADALTLGFATALVISFGLYSYDYFKANVLF